MKITHEKYGFTLMELIISMSLIVIVSGILVSIISINFNILDEVSDRKKLVTRGVLALTLFERELGMLKDSTSIVYASASQLKFDDNYGNTWEYTISGNTFTRQEVGVGSAQILASPVSNSITKFQYYKGDNTELTSFPLSNNNLKLARLIRLRLVMDDGGDGVSLLSSVYPENYKVFNH